MTCRSFTRARGRRKGSSFCKIAELATRRPAWNYSRPGSLLPSAITNELPVIENNRCVRVMLPEDRVLARDSVDLRARGEYKVHLSSDETRKRRCLLQRSRWRRHDWCARIINLASNNLHFRPLISHYPSSRFRHGNCFFSSVFICISYLFYGHYIFIRFISLILSTWIKF